MWSAVLSALARAVWPGAMVLCCGVGAAVSSVERVSKWVSGSVVLEAVRVVHVIICKCVVQRGVWLVRGFKHVRMAFMVYLGVLECPHVHALQPATQHHRTIAGPPNDGGGSR